MFSVVIPLYNKEKSISSTINSVLSQTYGNFELIVVNDGSTDNSLKIVESINDVRIRVINKENGGVSSARNRGIQEAKNEWIAFLDGDDLWLCEYLEEANRMIKKYTKASVISIKSKRNSSINTLGPATEGYIEDYFFMSGKYGYFINSSSIIINKKCFNELGGFKTFLSFGEDLEMWNRIVKLFDVAFSPRLLSIYRDDIENRSIHRKKINIKSHFAYYIDLSKEITNSEKDFFERIFEDTIIRSIRSSDFASLKLLIKKHSFIKILSLLSIALIKRFRTKLFRKNAF